MTRQRPENGTEADLPRRLLIVDDDRDFAGSLTDILEPRGYQVAEAYSAQRALETLQHFDADVALVDIRLDRNSGIELIARLREVRADILCVMMTAYAGVETAIEALHQGAYDYLRKPLNAHDLFATIERCFEKLRLERDKDRAEAALRSRNQELEEVNARLRKIVESAKGLAVRSQWGEIGPHLLEEFAQNMAAEGGSLFLREREALVLVHSLDPGHAPGTITLPLRKGSIFEQALNAGEPVLIANIHQESDVEPSGWKGYKDGSLLVFPLQDDAGMVVGVLSLHNRTASSFTRQDQDLGSILASYGSETLRATRAHQALRESEEKYRTILESIKEGYFELDLAGNFTFFNDSLCEILGYPREELLGLNRRACTTPETAIRMDEVFDAICQTGKPAITADHEVLRKDGTSRILEMSTSLLLNSAGEAAGFRCVVRDISERKRAEEERQRLATAVEHAAESILVADKDGTIHYVNPAFERISGYSRDEVIGKSFRLFADSEQNDAAYDVLWTTLERGEVWKGQITNCSKDGRPCEFETTISPIRDHAGVITSFVSVNRDVTHEVQLKKQLLQAQKMEAIGTLSGGIAHDFNNILQAVLGYAELLLLGKKEGERGHRELREIIGAAKKGAELIQQLLTFSRKQESNRRPLDLNHEVLEVRKLLARTIPKMIEIELHLSDDLQIINADAVQMQQTLMNLTLNAKDAMPDGGKLTIATNNLTLDEAYGKPHFGVECGDYVRLSISDTGHGMDRETLEHIFEPFFSTKGPGSGTGLGLAMVYGIISAHDGFITCSSEPERGTCFQVYLPAIDQVAPIEASQEGRVAVERGQETILIVDDEEYIRDFGNQVLAMHGYQVLTAADGESALELYRGEQDRIDLVIMDLIMPGMGGSRCLQEILAINPQARVIVASGHAAEGSEREIVRSGARAFVRKPFEIRDLLWTMRRVLDARPH
jgi:PAS domain S-box-containing protein